MRKKLSLVLISDIVLVTTMNTGNALASKSPAPNPIPITLPVSPIGDITFENITQRIDKISLTAYNAVQQVLTKNTQPKLATTVAVGPRTTASVSDVPGSFRKIMKFWSGFRLPKTYYALIYNFEDKAWAKKKAATIPAVKSTGGIKGTSNLPALIDQCTAPTQCSSANSGIEDVTGNGIGQFAMDPVHIAQDPFFQIGGI